MITPIRDAVAALLGGAVALAVMLVVYEGIPLGPLRRIPVVGPALESITDGRVDRERKAGALSERLAWQEKQQRLLIQQIEKEKAKQAELDEIAQRYREEINARISDAIKISALEDALKEEEKDAPPNAGPVCKFMPRGVSKQLNAIGR